jgi:hypothetical protein
MATSFYLIDKDKITTGRQTAILLVTNTLEPIAVAELVNAVFENNVLNCFTNRKVKRIDYTVCTVVI